MSSDVLVTTESGPWVILSTISRLLSRSDLEQDQATIISCVSWSLPGPQLFTAHRALHRPGLHLASPDTGTGSQTGELGALQ